MEALFQTILDQLPGLLLGGIIAWIATALSYHYKERRQKPRLLFEYVGTEKGVVEGHHDEDDEWIKDVATDEPLVKVGNGSPHTTMHVHKVSIIAKGRFGYPSKNAFPVSFVPEQFWDWRELPPGESITLRLKRDDLLTAFDRLGRSGAQSVRLEVHDRVHQQRLRSDPFIIDVERLRGYPWDSGTS